MTTTTSAITLRGGEHVEATLTTIGSDTRVTVDFRDVDGALLLTADHFDSGIGVDPLGGFLQRIDSFAIAPLENGDFAYATYKHNTMGAGAPDAEVIFISEVTPTEHFVTFGGNAVGFNLPTIGVQVQDSDFAGPPAILALSGSHFAAFYNGLDRATPIQGVTLMLDDKLNSTNVLFASQPTGMSRDGVADLQVRFANGDQVLVAGAGHSILPGGDGDDTLVGDGGANVIAGGAGDDSASGGAGDDTINEVSGNNILRGGDGNDSILGGSGFDDINGNKGDDTIAGGGSGSDWLVGGQGDDSITGQGDFSILYGNLGNDTLNGGSGGEWLRGGQGDDLISGGGGDDWISGDRGNDTEIGGSGADTFNGFSGIGLDRILDFHTSEGDRIQLDPGTHFTLTQVGADTVIDLGAGDRMVLVGVDMTTLSPGWIFGS